MKTIYNKNATLYPKNNNNISVLMASLASGSSSGSDTILMDELTPEIDGLLTSRESIKYSSLEIVWPIRP